ncbi:class II lanthipeptide, LchA2/BrtA2 family [Clostridium oceanicum]|uniref:Uncharacterized protein n=1 Tax=Clostridium oceanicum TaxID=1543 RepID=A0ABP3V5M9_9CLOT
MKNYEKLTGFVPVEELQETADELKEAGGFTALACAVSGAVTVALSVVGCPTGACSGHC